MTFNLYHFCIFILYLPTLTVFITFIFINRIKRFFLLNNLIFIRNFINEVAVAFNIGFLVVAIYISIYYFHEFYYFINLDNMSIENNSDCIVNCDINNYAFNNNTDKEICLFKNSKYFQSIDLYGSRSDMLVNMVSKNNSEHSDELSIVKYLEIYRSVRVDFNLIENELIDHNRDLINKIFKLEKRIYNTTNIINEIIDDYCTNNN